MKTTAEVQAKVRELTAWFREHGHTFVIVCDDPRDQWLVFGVCNIWEATDMFSCVVQSVANGGGNDQGMSKASHH